MGRIPRKKSLGTEVRVFAASLRDALVLFGKNDPLRMAGATAFFTTFALPPIVFILVRILGLFIDRRVIGQGLITRLSNTLGKNGADQVREVIRSIHSFSNNIFVITVGFIFLVFVATTLFGVISNSLDQIWQIGLKKTPSSFWHPRKRLRSMSIIILIGILFVADLLFDGLAVATRNYLDGVWKGSGVYIKESLNSAISLITVASWFILLFHFLGDGRPSWKASVVGGAVTGVLFSAGKLLLRFLLVDSNVGQLYGSSASLVLVLLFVFYSSFILYYGACFIAIYSQNKKWPLRLNKNAYNYKIEKMEKPARL